MNIKNEKQKLEHVTKEEEARLKSNIQKIKDDYEAQIDDKIKRKEALQQDLFKLKKVEEEKESITTEIAKLQIECEQEKKQGMIEINDLERAKIIAVKKLSEEMDYKVKETQANLMALNDEQLHTTTRLTIL